MNARTQTNPQARMAFQISLIAFIATLISDLIYIVLLVQQPSWQLLTVLVINTLVLLGGSIAAMIMARRSRIVPAMVVLIAAAQITFPIGTILVTGWGLAFGLGIGFITAMIASPTLRSRDTVITAFTAAASGIVCVVMDQLAPSYRLAPPPIMQIGVQGIVLMAFLLFGLILFRQLQTSLRARLLLSFTILFLVVGLFGGIVIQQQRQATQKAATTQAADIVEAVALSVGTFPASAPNYVAQLYQKQHRPVEIVDSQMRVSATPLNAADIYRPYALDPGNNVAATLKDGQSRTFLGKDAQGQATLNMMVVPVKDTSGKITGAAIIDYTNILNALQASTNATTQIFITVGAIALLLTFAMIQFLSNTITEPIIVLKSAAQEVSEGNLDVDIPDRPARDEVGTLTLSFKNMAAQLRDLVTNLEQRVKERTSELATSHEEVARRANQLDAISKVTQSITTVSDLETILGQIALTINQEFGFYHVGIFLLDEVKQYAILKASNSEGGRRMLERGHQLKVGEQGIVGHVALSATPRIALDTGADATYFDNPDLRATRSEMALPLVLNRQILGVLDVQSQEPSAFQKDDVEVLTTLANQVSIAIQNARLFDETNRALRETRALYEQNRREALGQTFEEKEVGYQYTGTEVVPLEKLLSSPEIQTAYSKGNKVIKLVNADKGIAKLTIPIKLREEVIGVVDVRSKNKADWNEDEIDIAEAVAERVAIAVENAALLSEAQRRAEIERLTSEISGKIGASTQFDSILRTAAEELSRVLGGSEVLVQLHAADEKKSNGGQETRTPKGREK